MKLAEFLLARIAEDEAGARRVDGMHFAELLPAAQVFGMRGLMMPAARVLAECEAKRRIVEFAEQCRMDELRWPSGNGVMTARYGAALVAVKLLALPYADHPDYRQAWAP